ncbi:hypothetical protein [Streptomyces sp. NPDC127039]|uniref:hypothetical protein n=1 Tax=Streptomyces sp. NPDC127039 TaxID=3347115 RepID=UPI003665FD63
MTEPAPALHTGRAARAPGRTPLIDHRAFPLEPFDSALTLRHLVEPEVRRTRGWATPAASTAGASAPHGRSAHDPGVRTSRTGHPNAGGLPRPDAHDLASADELLDLAEGRPTTAVP